MKIKKQGILDLRVLPIVPIQEGHEPDTSWMKYSGPSDEFSEGLILEVCSAIHDEKGSIPWRKRKAISPLENDIARGRAIRILRWFQENKEAMEFL